MTLEQLYKTKRKSFVYKIYPYFGDYGKAEDVVQEAFIKAYQKLSQYKKERGPLKNWFNSILFSTMWNHKRVLKKTPFLMDIMECLESSVLGQLDQTELPEILEGVKNKLHRKVLATSLVLGYSVKETSDLLEVSQDNVVKIVQRFKNNYEGDVGA